MFTLLAYYMEAVKRRCWTLLQARVAKIHRLPGQSSSLHKVRCCSLHQIVGREFGLSQHELRRILREIRRIPVPGEQATHITPEARTY